MSFSAECKSELEERIGSARHCRLAEMQAIWYFRMQKEQESRADAAVRKFFTILEKTFNIDADQEQGAVKGTWSVPQEVVQAIEEPCDGRSCCRRAFLRGAFLCAGTVSDPAKSYQLEIVCRTRELAEKVREMLTREGITAGMTLRNSRYVVYMRDGDEITTLLGLMEAQRALLKMENERVLKDVRGNINRRVNLEAANLGKAAGAAARQIQAIERLLKMTDEEELPASLREMAHLRLTHPDATLEELGAMLNPPVGKSGVNHRLRRIEKMSLMENPDAVRDRNAVELRHRIRSDCENDPMSLMEEGKNDNKSS